MLDAIDGKLEIISDYVIANRPAAEQRIEVKAHANIDALADAPLVNQKGESVNTDGEAKLTTDTVERLNFDTVKKEAQLLCNIDKETTKSGFHKAKEIISSYGIGKLEDLAPTLYDEIVEKFREAVKDGWKI